MVSPTFTSGPSTLGWRSPMDSHSKNCSENPGPVLQKLWHIETTPFKKFMTDLRKWKNLPHIPRFLTSTVKPKNYGGKTQMSFVRKACAASFPTWSLNFQIADTCTHCVPIFYFVIGRINMHLSPRPHLSWLVFGYLLWGWLWNCEARELNAMVAVCNQMNLDACSTLLPA